MRISIKHAWICLILQVFLVSCFAQSKFDLKVTTRILDDCRNPINDAQVKIAFGVDPNRIEAICATGLSDKNGYFYAEARTYGQIGVTVKKEAYYEWVKSLSFFKNPDEDFIRPYNPSEKPIVITMRKRVNPIPMYAKKVETKIPKPGVEYGYDLIFGDWVAPLGDGKTKDLIFKTEGYWNNYRDNYSELTLTFSNDTDGIIAFEADPMCGSKLRSSNLAPAEGYQNRKVWVQMRKPAEEDGKTGNDIVRRDYDKRKNYYLRVRSKTDKEGRIISALYGKIYGDIKYGGASENGCFLIFKYYLNPNYNDRNIEFDPKQNLFKNLPPLSQVNEP